MTDSHDRHDPTPPPRAFLGEPPCADPNCACHAPWSSWPQQIEAQRAAELDRARAAGYAQAVANCRDDARYDAWVRTQPHSWTRADYLEAIGPQKDQKLTEEDRGWRVGRHLGRTLYRNGELQGLLDDPALAQRIADVLNAAENGEVEQ